MRICIDSSVIIPGLQGNDPDAVRLLELIGPAIILLIPRLIAQEVTRNLDTPEQVRRFYHLFQAYSFAFIIDEPVPHHLAVSIYFGSSSQKFQSPAPDPLSVSGSPVFHPAG